MTKILVVEDETNIREKLITVLGFEGFETLGAADGRSGVELARAEHPDLIVCDIMMPDLNGYGALRELRADPTTAAIPIIFLTAAASRADMRKGMELGADDYITKPYTVEELLAAVRTRLSRQRTIRAAGPAVGVEVSNA
jgi:DNA-binding response OmpR family regulator